MPSITAIAAVTPQTCGGAEHAHASGGVLDNGQDVLTLPVQGDGLDEIASQKSLGSRAQEVGPRDGRPLGCWIKPFLLEDLPDRRRGDLDAERGEFAVHSPMSSSRILPNPGAGREYG
ncbi:hypothetical protein ACIBQ1_51505 [Nonomuraea sp. NPDC050153]|uniref:hypothetical protein n=1 Tax=Nonomuraea sp. NPDC050153 TaxID=3364359 RepID=UPI00378D9C97